MKKGIIRIFLLSALLAMYQLSSAGTSNVKSEKWGEVEGKEVELITMTNINGMVVMVTNYGATITSISVPDKNGELENVVIGYDSLRQYITDRGNHGKTIGRFANRIGGAQFTLDGVTYKLAANNRGNTLHGGERGFAKQVFEVDTAYSKADSSVVAFHYLSADGEEGFPGELILHISFILTDNNELKLAYRAETNKPTVVNFTNHSYFNLSGSQSPIWDEKLMIVADSVTPLGENGLPTGKLEFVGGTPYDFRNGEKVGEKRDPDAWGYDINYKLSKKGNELALAAEVTDFDSGRILRAYTTEPGMQLFSMGNAICLEMQHFPDSPNIPQFPSVVLNPGEVYHQLTVYAFSTIPE